MNTPIDVFSEWAKNGKDEGMERHHYQSVMNMINFASSKLSKYSFIDAGCGNGWVIRKVAEDPKCSKAIGVDGSKNMIDKAKRLDVKNKYYCEDLLTWVPNEKADIIHSMEVFYYLEDPKRLIDNIYKKWLKQYGRLIIGMDFYKEKLLGKSY